MTRVMSSKTILIGLSIFRCGVEKSVHGRPSWELAPYDCSLQNTKDFTVWCKLVSRECKFNDRAGECGVVRYITQFFVLDKAKALPIKIGSFYRNVQAGLIRPTLYLSKSLSQIFLVLDSLYFSHVHTVRCIHTEPQNTGIDFLHHLLSLLFRISQTAWDAVRLDFIDNKEKVITKDYELHGRCDFLVLCTVILHFSQSPIVTIVVHAF